MTEGSSSDDRTWIAPMKVPRTKAKRDPGACRKREKGERDDDHRLRPLHMFGDIGPAIAEADYKPITLRHPGEDLATIFARLGRDYGGQLPAFFNRPLKTIAYPKAQSIF
jgi:hypothetical protein